jgi:HEAT repeat protein
MEDPQTGISAGSTLGFLGAREAIPAMMRFYERADLDSRKTLLFALSSIDDVRPLPLVRQGLSSRNRKMREQAKRALFFYDIRRRRALLPEWPPPEPFEPLAGDPPTPARLEQYLASPNKPVRLRALMLMLRHPNATPLQVVKSLCSPDNRNFEFMKIFGMHRAMRGAWIRLRGVTDEAVYSYLATLYASDPTKQHTLVSHALEQLSTPQALAALEEMKSSVPRIALDSIEHACDVVERRLAAK